jgi:hypothetical protein
VSCAGRGRAVLHRAAPTFTVACARHRAGTVGASLQHRGVTDEPAPTALTVHERLTAAGLSAERIAEHMSAGRVRVDGELVTDLDAPAPAVRGSRCGRGDLASSSTPAAVAVSYRLWPAKTGFSVTSQR